jgi:hypothetical protein
MRTSACRYQAKNSQRGHPRYSHYPVTGTVVRTGVGTGAGDDDGLGLGLDADGLGLDADGLGLDADGLGLDADGLGLGDGQDGPGLPESV